MSIERSRECILFALIIIYAPFINCIDLAPTVEGYPSVRTSPAEELGTLMPRIQLVYPGALQTLDVPQSYPTDVNPDAASIVVVFSHMMENDGPAITTANDDGEMFLNLTLLKDGAYNPIAISPSGQSSKIFTINPIGEVFQGDTVYTFRIYKFASVDDDASRILDFENLVEPPASTLNPVNPDYVDYTFRTGSEAAADHQNPIVQITTPGDGNTNVDPTLGYIEIVFSDNNIPMIYPPTVNQTSIILRNLTDFALNDPNGIITLLVEMDTNDLDFKTYRAAPQLPLGNSKQYKLTISPSGAKVEDFHGNSINTIDIFFSTAP